MRDAAGDSGEFYTPRPVIRFMVEQVDPALGERILDPACGTGGFLVETLEHIRGPRSRRASEEGAGGSKATSGASRRSPSLSPRDDEPASARGPAAAPHPRQRARTAGRRDPKSRPRRRRADQPTLRRRGGEGRSRPTSPEGDQRTAETAWLLLQFVQRGCSTGAGAAGSWCRTRCCSKPGLAPRSRSAC